MSQQYLVRVNMDCVVLGIHICVPHASNPCMCQKKGVTYYYYNTPSSSSYTPPPPSSSSSFVASVIIDDEMLKIENFRYCFMFGILLLCEIPIWFLTFHPLSLLHLLILLTIIIIHARFYDLFHKQNSRGDSLHSLMKKNVNTITNYYSASISRALALH